MVIFKLSFLFICPLAYIILIIIHMAVVMGGTLGTLFLAKCTWRHSGYTFFLAGFLVVLGPLEISAEKRVPRVLPETLR